MAATEDREFHSVDELFMTGITTPSEASFDDPESGLRAAYRFLKHLPRIDKTAIPEDQGKCEICFEDYGTDGNDQTVVQLPNCGHRFGFNCMYQWLSPTNIPNQNSCPKCRAILFEMDHLEDSDEEMEYNDESDIDDEENPLLPELRALLALDGLDSFGAAVDLMEPFVRGELQLPRGLIYSRQIFGMFICFQMVIVVEGSTNSSLVESIAGKFATLLGHLHLRFQAHMEFLQSPTPWRDNGPRMSDLLDRDMHGMIEIGINHFINFEELYGQRLRRNAHSE